jgi:uncharacterized membrane protein
METLPAILSVLVLAVLVLPIVALVTSASATRQLREEMDRMMGRIHYIEAQLSQMAREQKTAALAPPPVAAQQPQPSPAPPQFVPSPPPIASSPLPTLQAVAEAHEPDSLESRIGSRWFNRVGILAVLVGLASFLKLAVDNHWIGPLGRVLVGLLAGAALIAWSWRFQKRGFAAFSYSLKAIGSGALYLSLWAAYQLYALLPSAVAFAAMIAVTAFNGLMAWTQNAELLALYAIAGGLSTPLLVSTGENHQVALFLYLLILDLAVLILTVFRPWSRLLFVSFAGTAAFVAAWWFSFYTQAQAPRTAWLLGCFLLLFSLAPRLIDAKLHSDEPLAGWDALALVILPVANAALCFLGFYSLLDSGAVSWAAPWIAVAFAAFYLMLLRLPAKGMLLPGAPLLDSLHLSLAVVFLTIAIPLKTQGWWMTIGWLIEGCVLIAMAARSRSLLVRAFALLCLALGLVGLLLTDAPAAVRPILNQRFGAYCVAIAACAFMAWLATRSTDEDAPFPPLHWLNLAAAGALLVNILILIAFSLEIHSFWWLQRWHGDQNLLRDFRMYSQFTYSAFFMLFAALLLFVGFFMRSAFLRWQALVLIAVTMAKVFLVDTSELDRVFRILSLIALGVLLLGVSYAYQRDWLNLRGKENPRP